MAKHHTVAEELVAEVVAAIADDRTAYEDVHQIVRRTMTEAAIWAESQRLFALLDKEIGGRIHVYLGTQLRPYRNAVQGLLWERFMGRVDWSLVGKEVREVMFEDDPSVPAGWSESRPSGWEAQ